MKRPLRSIYGQYVSTVDDFRLMSTKGHLVGDWGDQWPLASPIDVVQFDDFLGASLSNAWAVAKGTDAAAANFAITAALSGAIQGTTGATTTTMAGSGIQISGALNFQAQGNAGTGNTNNLELNTKVQLSAIAGLCVFVGLTNQTAALQMPIQGAGAGNGFTVNAANAVGFLYDTTMTTQDWWGVSSNTSVAGAGQDSGSGPTAGTYDQFQISIDQYGNANFFRNRVQVGVTVSGAVNPAVPLAPVVAAFSRIAASKNVVVDRMMASMTRI